MVYVIPTDTCFWFACNIYDKKNYKKIYAIKWRNFIKPLPILVKTFEDLEYLTEINVNQINYLKSYPYPFTLLIKPNKNFKYPDFIEKNDYKKIAIRIAEICIPWEFLHMFNYPLFLTSANISDQKELFSSLEIKKEFNNNLKDLEIIEAQIEKRPASNIFEFIKDSLEINFIRKNY